MRSACLIYLDDSFQCVSSEKCSAVCWHPSAPPPLPLPPSPTQTHPFFPTSTPSSTSSPHPLHTLCTARIVRDDALFSHHPRAHHHSTITTTRHSTDCTSWRRGQHRQCSDRQQFTPLTAISEERRPRPSVAHSRWRPQTASES